MANEGEKISKKISKELNLFFNEFKSVGSLMEEEEKQIHEYFSALVGVSEGLQFLRNALKSGKGITEVQINTLKTRIAAMEKAGSQLDKIEIKTDRVVRVVNWIGHKLEPVLDSLKKYEEHHFTFG